MPNLKIYDKNGEPHQIDAQMGETLWMACQRAGVELPHSCGFGCQCSTCVVQLVKGHQNLSHLDEEEVERMNIEGMTIADPEDPEAGSDSNAFPYLPEEDKIDRINLESNPRMACRLSCACQIYGDVVLQQPET